MRLVAGRLYLERYWLDDQTVRRSIALRAADDGTAGRSEPGTSDGRLLTLARSTFPAGVEPDERQVSAVVAACTNSTLVLAGGPGTGKTATVARMLVALLALSPTTLRVALAAPSGKAAARLSESVDAELARLDLAGPSIDPAVTVHRLLGARGPLRGFSRGPLDRLPHDVVVIDEMSMMSLPLMATLMRAVEPSTRVILVGDPLQLASVEAGQVLADLTAEARAGVGPVPVVELVRNWRSRGAVADLAAAVRVGDADDALRIAMSGADGVEMWPVTGPARLADIAPVLARVRDVLTRTAVAAAAGDAAEALRCVDEHRILCAHRHGPFGVTGWARQVDDVAAALGVRPAGHPTWYPGRGVLITGNADELSLRNGDTGLVVRTPHGLQVAFPSASGPRLIPPGLLDHVDTTNAMTIHKGQGSQFPHVTLVLPPVHSPLLTRELVYTAITRTMDSLTIVGDPQALDRGVRAPVQRISPPRP